MTKKEIFTILFYILIFGLGIYISGPFALITITFSLAFYSILTYLIYAIYKKVRDRSFGIFDLANYNDYFKEFIYKVGSLMTLFILVVGGFAFYENEISPARMPVYEVSNGEKTLVFHTMSHIGTPDFYQKVKQNIEILKKDGYTLYFEGVRPGSEENQKKFEKALGVKFDKNTYAAMSKLYGLVNQDNQIFLGLVNNNDVNVDVTMDDIVRDYEALKLTNTVSSREYENPIDVSQELMKELSKMGENELRILRYINKSFINVIVKSDDLQAAIQSEFANQALFQVILDKRNQVVADKIITSDDKKMVATYGMLHFEGILNILKQKDPRWQIRKIDYLYPLK